VSTDQNQKMPIEWAMKETRRKLWEVIQTNQLGAGINRMIFQEIADRLAMEEQQIIMQAEMEKEERKNEE